MFQTTNQVTDDTDSAGLIWDTDGWRMLDIWNIMELETRSLGCYNGEWLKNFLWNQNHHD